MTRKKNYKSLKKNIVSFVRKRKTTGKMVIKKIGWEKKNTGKKWKLYI